MNVGKIFAAGSRERVFQLKAKRDAGIDAPRWQAPQFLTCKKCERRATRQVWAQSLYVCPNCGKYQPIGGYYRLSLILDHGTFRELDEKLEEALAIDGPVICEVFVTMDQNFEPKSAAKKLPDGTLVSPPLEDLAPFLSDEEMDENMIIERIKK